jgi:hypothetical protein
MGESWYIVREFPKKPVPSRSPITVTTEVKIESAS